ncbi:anti-sigma factor family protein [Pilimelia columellifera]|uniref:Zf-HC2 domain-containing protein n=1 Tax=Pilimelia columellifera subsp. columellifera TaxID=706583 RepID=A0ABN3MWN5_9ACTN
MKCEHEHADAAYVLGALSPAERTDYERHLAGCVACREGVADLAGLPGLLGRLDAAAVEALMREDPPAPSVGPGPAVSDARSADQPAGYGRPSVTRRVDAGDVRFGRSAARPGRVTSRPSRVVGPATAPTPRPVGRVRYLAGGLLTAGLLLVLAVGTQLVRGPGAETPGGGPNAVRSETPADSTLTPGSPLATMVPVSRNVPLTAQVGLLRHGYGTEITMRCAYDRDSSDAPTWTVHLFAYGPDEAREQVGSWVASPGDRVQFSGVTRFSGDQLQRLEVVRSTDGAPLLSYDVP